MEISSERSASSALSWLRTILVTLLMALLIYLAIYGSFALLLRNTTPFSVVTSDSMKHDGEGWRSYFTERGVDTTGFPFQGGFERGDILLVQGCSADEISVGDVIVFSVPGLKEFTHRVVERKETEEGLRFTTKGDANTDPGWFEQSIPPERIMGRAVAVIPKLGHIWLWLSGR